MPSRVSWALHDSPYTLLEDYLRLFFKNPVYYVYGILHNCLVGKRSMNAEKSGKLFIVSASSGAGKTTLVRHVVNRLGHAGLKRVITYTTKAPRKEEVAGVDYHFLTEEEFKEKIAQDYFVEHSNAYGAYYGFPRMVLGEVAVGAFYITILDRAGAAALKAHMDNVVLIWIKPPTQESLQQRLVGRAQDDALTIASRLALAEQERALEEQENLFHHVIVNDEFHVAAGLLEEIIRKELLCDLAHTIK